MGSFQKNLAKLLRSIGEKKSCRFVTDVGEKTASKRRLVQYACEESQVEGWLEGDLRHDRCATRCAEELLS